MYFKGNCEAIWYVLFRGTIYVYWSFPSRYVVAYGLPQYVGLEDFDRRIWNLSSLNSSINFMNDIHSKLFF